MMLRLRLPIASVARLAAAVVAVWTLVGLGAAAPAAAQASAAARAQAARNRFAERPSLFIDIPLDRRTPGVVFPFGGSHHQVPGVVAVNRAPYYCVPHQSAFRDRMDFVAHLRTRHGLVDDEIGGAVLVSRGQVRFIGP